MWKRILCSAEGVAFSGKILRVDLSPSENRIGVCILSDGKSHSKPIYLSAKTLIRKTLRIQKEIYRLEHKIDEVYRRTVENLSGIRIPDWKSKVLSYLFSSWFFGKVVERLRQKAFVSCGQPEGLDPEGVRQREPLRLTPQLHVEVEKLLAWIDVVKISLFAYMIRNRKLWIGKR